MRIGVMLALVLGGMGSAVAAPSSAPSSTMTVDGEVIDSHARWSDDGTRIVTSATVQTPDGEVVVSQLGGTVDGLTMRTFPGPEILAPGMRVAVAAHQGLDLAQRMHVVVDQVRVLEQAPGFVRTGPTKAGKSLYWESGCVLVTVDAGGTKEIVGDLEFPAIDAAISEWNTKTSSCSYMQIVKEATEAHEVGRDNRNMIKIRDQSWCRPAIGDDPMRCYGHSAAGLTTAVFVDDATSSRDGAIVDADIELNGVDFSVSLDGQTTGTSSCLSDLRNTLTHELGHLQGLEHPCLVAGDPARVDGDGKPVPQCSGANATITETTMYNFQECGETKKADLSPDDIAGICAIYPISADPGVCEAVPDGGGCCSASSDHSVTGLLGAVVTVLVLRRRRKT
ncbi:MAG: peptidase and matrixin and adamalysin [Deltaproteobacteria bacterium]|nr:peptidase and matrixin and adamalysin [Deltaproteobacteria bacterium]